MFLVFSIIIVLLVILFRSRISFMVLVLIDSDGFHLNIKVMYYKLLTLFSWGLEQGGLSFLLNKKKNIPEHNKKEKGRVSAILEMFFSKDTYNHLKKNLEIFDLSITGRLATSDAAFTALLFGWIWAFAGILIPFIPQKRIILDFYPDFKKESPDFNVSCILRVRIIHIIVLIVNYYKEKIRKGRGIKYGTASN